jgi:hypothetical protein
MRQSLKSVAVASRHLIQSAVVFEQIISQFLYSKQRRGIRGMDRVV